MLEHVGGGHLLSVAFDRELVLTMLSSVIKLINI